MKFLKFKLINLELKEKGYTLIELLTVMIIIVVVGAIVAGVIVSSLRGGSKSNILNSVQEKGNYALSQLSKSITYAQEFNGVSINGDLFSTDCTQYIPPSPAPSPTPVSYKYIKITNFDGEEKIFSCADSTISSNGVSLISTSSSFFVSSCSFSCTQDYYGMPQTIGINFSLAQTGSSFAEKRAEVSFHTLIRIRNNNL